MIQLTNASKRFGPKLLFDNVDWLVTTGERTGLVGGNGTGKSTLLKVLAGSDTLDGGTLVSTKGISAGYLPQDGLTLSGRTVFNECLTVFAEVQAMEREIETLSRRISELVEEAARKGYEAGDLRERLEHAARLAEAGRFSEANMLLNIVEIRLPRKTESVVPAAEDEPAPSQRKLRRKARRNRSRP